MLRLESSNGLSHSDIYGLRVPGRENRNLKTMRQVCAWYFIGIERRKVWLQFQREKEMVGDMVKVFARWDHISLLGHYKEFGF